jgi:hypothetical protein
VAEEILAGKGPMKFLATPRQPRFSLSLWISIIIDLYYVISFLVLAHLLQNRFGACVTFVWQ